MNSDNLVSAIITTFNRSHLLKRAIESVLNQTYTNIELIIIDDCSTDNTPNIVKKYLETDSRIKYLRNKINLDAQKSRNIAVNHAIGYFVAFLDDDDEWLPKKLEYQVTLAHNHSIVGCLHAFNKVPKNKTIEQKPKNISRSLNQFYYSNKGFSPSKNLTKREYYLGVGGFNSLYPGPEGIDFFIKVINKYGDSAIYIDEILTIHYIDHGLNRITTSNRMLRGSIREYLDNKPYRDRSANKFRYGQILLLKYKYANKLKYKCKYIILYIQNIEFKYFTKYLRVFRTRVFEDNHFLFPIKNIYHKIKYR